MVTSLSRQLLAGFAATGIFVLGSPVVRAADATADLISRGAYLANAGDCAGCHSAKGGKPFAGGLPMDTPFGTMYSANITPDKETGIGGWTDEQFYRVMHDGIGHKGEYLYPSMPFPWYTTVSRDDVLAIKAFLFTQAPVHQAAKPNKLDFPVGIRTSMLAWRVAFFKPGEFKPDPNHTAEVNRGDYLVNGLAHCGECHNSRPVAGTSRFRQAFQGGAIDNWYAPNITSDLRDGIGGWSNQEIATYLKTGSAPGKGVAAGPMAETVHSLSHLNDADLLAMAAYLKTTPAKSDGDRQMQLYAGRAAPGGSAYLTYCASCHGVDGKGLAGAIPALVGNGAVDAKGPQNVIQVVLGGLPAQKHYAPMLAIGAGMTDQDVADVANYVRQTWGNQAPPTAQAGMVGELRKKTDTLMSAGSALSCPAVTTGPLAKAIGDPRNHLATDMATITEADMPQRVEQIVRTLRRAVPAVPQADLVNGLTTTYCGAVRSDATLDARQRALRLGHFSELVYVATTSRIAQ